jgi:hypothetical protein
VQVLERLGYPGAGRPQYPIAIVYRPLQIPVDIIYRSLQNIVTKSLYVGVEAIYQELDSATTPTGAVPGIFALSGSGATTIANESNWVFTLRLHKDFLQ